MAVAAAAEILLAFLACIGLMGLGCLLYGRLRAPAGGAETWAVIPGRGDGGGLEQAVGGLLWLRERGFWQGDILIADCGLTPQGREAARGVLARWPEVALCAPEEVGARLDPGRGPDTEE